MMRHLALGLVLVTAACATENTKSGPVLFDARLLETEDFRNFPQPEDNGDGTEVVYIGGYFKNRMSVLRVGYGYLPSKTISVWMPMTSSYAPSIRLSPFRVLATADASGELVAADWTFRPKGLCIEKKLAEAIGLAWKTVQQLDRDGKTGCKRN